MKEKSLRGVRLLATPWTAAHQAPPSMGFSRQEYWSGCHCLIREVFLVISISQEDVSILVFSVKLKENKCATVKQRSVFETISKYCSVMMNLKASASDSAARVGCFEWETIERWLTLKSVCEHTHAVACLSPWGCAVLGRRLGTEEKPFMGTGALGDLCYILPWPCNVHSFFLDGDHFYYTW